MNCRFEAREPRFSEGFKWGLDTWGVGSANLGRPIFAPKICRKTLVLKGFGEILRQKWGAPNLQIQHPTDPTPHLKPSNLEHVSEYGVKSDRENRCAFNPSHSGNPSGEPTVLGESLIGRLRIRFAEPSGKPMGRYPEPFSKPIGRANSTRGQP